MAPQIIDTENYYINSNKSIGDVSKSSGIRFGGSLWLKITSREIMEYVLLPYLHPVYFSVELICTKSKRLSIKDLFTLEALPWRLKKLDMISILAGLLYYILHVRSSVITFLYLSIGVYFVFFVCESDLVFQVKPV